jgi:ABC-type sugar transport system substrate-binding protein
MPAKSIVAALVAALFASTSASAQSVEGKRVALLTNVLTSGWIAGYNNTVTKLLTDKGVKVVNMTSPSDAALQSQQVDDAIAQKFDLILLHHINEVAIVPALERAKKAGVPVILSVDPIAPGPGHDDLYLSLVGFDIPDTARNGVSELIKAMGNKPAKVAIIQGIPQQAMVATINRVIKEEFAANAPNLQVVAVEGKSWRPAEAGTIARELMLRFAPHGGLQAIVAMNDFMASQVVLAVEASGGKPGQDVLVLSTGCGKPGLDEVRSGKMLSTMNNGPVNEAKHSAEVVLKVLAGDRNVPKWVKTPASVVTKATVDQAVENCTY